MNGHLGMGICMGCKGKSEISQETKKLAADDGAVLLYLALPLHHRLHGRLRASEAGKRPSRPTLGLGPTGDRL